MYEQFIYYHFELFIVSITILKFFRTFHNKSYNIRPKQTNELVITMIELIWYYSGKYNNKNMSTCKHSMKIS